MSIEEENDIPQLSAETFSVLQEFYKEQEENERTVNLVSYSLNNESNSNGGQLSLNEDWQLSQFWYDDQTALELANEVIRLAGLNCEVASIACISCPTLFITIRKHFPAMQYRGMKVLKCNVNNNRSKE